MEYGFGTVGHSKLLSRIEDRVRACDRVYLIVPEQQTVAAESECSALLPPSAALHFEATNFTRFQDTVFRSLGGIAGDYPGQVTSLLLMWRVLSEIAPLLSMTGEKNEVTPGVVARAMSAMKDAECAGITPEELGMAGSRIKSDPRLVSKLSDLALICSSYRELTKDDYPGLTDAIYTASDKLRENPDFLSDTQVFIDGFTSFTAPQYALIKTLISLCPVTVTVPLPRVLSDSFEFGEIRDTRTRLLALAKEGEVAVFDERIADTDPDASPIITEAARLIFRTDGELDRDLLQNNGNIRIFEASVPFDECDFIATDIKRRVMAGASYSDFAVIARNAEDYRGILDTALDREGVPHFTSSALLTVSCEAVKLISIAYDVACYGFRAEWVMGLGKCTLSGIERGECDALQGYIERWKPGAGEFTSPAPWSSNPRGYEEFTDSDRLLLDTVNRAKEKLISPLRRFSRATNEARTVREHALCLVDFLTDIHLEVSLRHRARLLSELSHTEEAELNSRLYKIICVSLDTLVSTLGDTPADGVSFVNLLMTVLSGTSVGRIPTHQDEVTVGSADMLRLRGKRHIYLIGVNEGVFPSTVKDNSYFTESDKARLLSVGLGFEPDLERQAARELYSFVRAFTAGSESVTLTYPTRSSAFSALSPSSVIERLSEISGGDIKPVRISRLPVIDRIYCPEDALLSLGQSGECIDGIKEALSDAGLSHRLDILDGEVANDTLRLGEGALGILYGSDMYLSQSRIDAFLRCPMLYFCRYNLKLNEAGSAELDSRIIGTFIHSILENFFRTLKDSHVEAGQLSEEDRRRITESAAACYVESALGKGDARRDVTVSRLCRAAEPIIDGLCEEFGSSKFRPLFFELTTNDRDPASPSTVKIDTDDGGRIIISGTMDRLDSFVLGDDVYVRVVDYKTGTKEFDPRNLSKGENLQMFLYLKSVIETNKPEFREALGVGEGGQVIPAGVIYVKTRVDDALIPKADDAEALLAAKKLQMREGMILDDPDSLDAQNPDFLPVRIKDGTIVETPIKRYYSREGWAEVDATVTEAVRDIGKRMKSGDLSVCAEDVRAFNSPCNSCKFRPLCRNGY